MIEEDLHHIVKWCEKRDKVIAYYDDYEPAWREMMEKLKELEKEFITFFERAQSEICKGQMMKVEHLSRLKELIGIDIHSPEVK